MPDQFAHEKELWSNFLRSSVTMRANGEDTSALSTTWVHKDPYTRIRLTNWYFVLITQATGTSPINAYAANAHVALDYTANAHAAPSYMAPSYAAPVQAAHAHAAPAYMANTHAAPAPPLALGMYSNGEEVPLLHDGGQRTELTMTTIDLLEAMTECLASGSSSSRATTKNCIWVELEYKSTGASLGLEPSA
jgi:hypothetical protein